MVLEYIHRPQNKDTTITFRPRFIPYSYMDPLGEAVGTDCENSEMADPVLPKGSEASDTVAVFGT